MLSVRYKYSPSQSPHEIIPREKFITQRVVCTKAGETWPQCGWIKMVCYISIMARIKLSGKVPKPVDVSEGIAGRKTSLEFLRWFSQMEAWLIGLGVKSIDHRAACGLVLILLSSPTLFDFITGALTWRLNHGLDTFIRCVWACVIGSCLAGRAMADRPFNASNTDKSRHFLKKIAGKNSFTFYPVNVLFTICMPKKANGNYHMYACLERKV